MLCVYKNLTLLARMLAQRAQVVGQHQRSFAGRDHVTTGGIPEGYRRDLVPVRGTDRNHYRLPVPVCYNVSKIHVPSTMFHVHVGFVIFS